MEILPTVTVVTTSAKSRKISAATVRAAIPTAQVTVPETDWGTAAVR
jgi:hypothetical protein